MTKTDGPLANEGTQDRARQKERLKRSQEIEDVSSVLTSPAGRRMFMSILEVTGALQPCAPSGRMSVDSYNSGLRDAGLTVLDWMYEASPAMASQAFMENAENQGVRE